MKKRLAFLTEPGALFGPQQLWRLLWPLLVEQLLSVLIGMIDVLMVSYVGESAVSGVSLVDSINHLILMVLFAMTSGGTVVCAQYLGKKDAASAAKSIAANSTGWRYCPRRTGAIAMCLSPTGLRWAE